MSWTISVIVISALLAVFTLWQEIRRANRSRLAWRIIACLLGIGALACIALPVSYRGEKRINAGNEAALLTGGFDPDSIGTSYKTIFTTERSIKKAYPKTILIGSLSEIDHYKPAIQKLHILGYGLDDSELPRSVTTPLIYHAPPALAGIQSINWPAKIKTGETFNVQGKYANAETKAVKLQLKGLDTVLDSVLIPAGKTKEFSLSAKPRNAGRAVYNLIALSGKDTLTAESLPLEIESVAPVKVLLLSASPNFETKFLKNWLAGNGYAVAARATISTNKITQEFVNIEKLPLGNITAPLLEKFDVVIGDLSALKSLSPAGNAALKQQVAQKGMGVIIRSDSSGKAASWLQSNFSVNTVATKGTLQVPIVLQGRQNRTAKLNIDASYIGNRNSLQTLAADGQNHILAASALNGAGKLVFTTLNHTYTWMLSGNEKDYAALWSLLIGQASRRQPAVAGWSVTTALPSVGDPVLLTLQSGIAPAATKVNGVEVSTEQNLTIPYQWNGIYHPDRAGWQQITMRNGTASWWYAYQKSDWQLLKNSRKIAFTTKYVSVITLKPTEEKEIAGFERRETPKLYFYLLLLASCTFLWVERKLNT